MNHTLEKIVFFVPAHNEEKIVEGSIMKLLLYCEEQNYPFFWQIEIVINGSSDRTLEICRQLQEVYPERILVKDFKEPGRGGALKKAWLATDADLVLYMDMDLAVSLDNISDLIRPLLDGDYDLAIGSRLLADSSIERSFIRELVSQTYNLLSRLILTHHFSDMQCGFKAIRSSVFKEIAPCLRSGAWFFDTELIIWARKAGYRIKDVPVDWSENRFEKRKSKVNLFTDSCKFFFNLIGLRYRTGFIRRGVSAPTIGPNGGKL